MIFTHSREDILENVLMLCPISAELRFKTYEEAAEFWESHDSTEYLDILEDVEIKVDIQTRHYLIELDENSARLLQENASKKGISASHLASKLFKKKLVSAG